MREVKEVFKRLAKVERTDLKSEKVELALMNDAKKAYKEYTNSLQSTFQNAMRVRKEARAIAQDVDKTEALAAKSRKLVDRLISKNKELFGDSELPQSVKDMDKVLESKKSILKDLRQWSNSAGK